MVFLPLGLGQLQEKRFVRKKPENVEGDPNPDGPLYPATWDSGSTLWTFQSDEPVKSPLGLKQLNLVSVTYNQES